MDVPAGHLIQRLSAIFRRMNDRPTIKLAWLLIPIFGLFSNSAHASAAFEGRFFRGEGDGEYLRLLEDARRMFQADPEFENLAMLYTTNWNGLVEGPTWDAWWVQNSYGTTYCSLPFLEEPFLTFLQNSQDLWFGKMGDGKTSYVWNGKDSWVPPDGCLMDCANKTWAMHRQGDGRVAIHDWGIEFTTAGALLQCELLLISRDVANIERYLPKLERCAQFIETRRDPKKNLFLAGPAGNLLAPSYAGFKRPDGTYGMAYLTGLSVTYIAFLDRLVELEKLAGRDLPARAWSARRATARQGLEALTTDEGYFVKSMDPDGTRHGVYGAKRFGYFESSPNHDAVCFRVVDDGQARKIYLALASIPGLRPHDLIIANYPSLDDMYEAPQGLWAFGTWVNGGHWTTCEARAIMAYYRVGAYDDARRSMRQILSFARRFRMDNPLVDFGNAVYQPKEPINLTYDAFGAPAALVRGLFEYLYTAEGLRLELHIPDGIEWLEQRFPIRFGTKRVYLAVTGKGPVAKVLVNGAEYKSFTTNSVFLPYTTTPELAAVQIVRGDATARTFRPEKDGDFLPPLPSPGDWPQPAAQIESKPGTESTANASQGLSGPVLCQRVARFRRFGEAMVQAGLGDSYEAAHARLTVKCLLAAHARLEALKNGKLSPLSPPSESAADQLYLSTVAKLCDGLEQLLDGSKNSKDERRRKIYSVWASAQ